MSNDPIQQIELSIKDLEEMVKLDDALRRLQSNRDFKRVINDGYLEKHAVRLVHLKSDPHMQSPERQASVIKEIDGIGALLDHFRTISRMGQQAREDIAAHEGELEMLRNEGAEE